MLELALWKAKICESRVSINQSSGKEMCKKKIKIEIARDKIYQIRLNERIAGVRTEQEDAARVQKWEEEGVDGV